MLETAELGPFPELPEDHSRETESPRRIPVKKLRWPLRGNATTQARCRPPADLSGDLIRVPHQDPEIAALEERWRRDRKERHDADLVEGEAHRLAQSSEELLEEVKYVFRTEEEARELIAAEADSTYKVIDIARGLPPGSGEVPRGRVQRIELQSEDGISDIVLERDLNTNMYPFDFIQETLRTGSKETHRLHVEQKPNPDGEIADQPPYYPVYRIGEEAGSRMDADPEFLDGLRQRIMTARAISVVVWPEPSKLDVPER